MAGWNNLDWTLTAIVVLSVAFSVIKGFTRELVSLLALIWSFLLAAWFYAPVSQRLQSYVRTPEVASLTAFLAILLAGIVVGAILSHLAGRLVEKAGLRWVDRVLGASFGLVRGILVAVILVLALATFSAGGRLLAESRTAPYIVHAARVLVTVAPADMRDRFRKGFERVQGTWDRRSEI